MAKSKRSNQTKRPGKVDRRLSEKEAAKQLNSKPKYPVQLNKYQRPLGAPLDPDALLRVNEVLRYVPVSRSTWWNGVRNGTYPKSIKLGPHTTVWRARDVLALSGQASKTNH
jgi:prophage regulatory protein